MTDKIVNLNRVRKARARDEKRQKADENAVRFGRSKAERELDALRADLRRQKLDNHRRDADEDQ